MEKQTIFGHFFLEKSDFQQKTGNSDYLGILGMELDSSDISQFSRHYHRLFWSNSDFLLKIRPILEFLPKKSPISDKSMRKFDYLGTFGKVSRFEW